MIVPELNLIIIMAYTSKLLSYFNNISYLKSVIETGFKIDFK